MSDERAQGDEWVFTTEQLRLHTASRLDNLKEEDEENYRAKTCELISALGMTRLKMSRQCAFVAAVIAHRFFTVESFKKRDRLVVAAVSLWIAGKLEEKQRSLTEIVGHYLATRNHLSELPNPESEIMKKTKALFVDYERLIMHSIGFHLYLDVPPAGKYFLSLTRMIRGNAPEGSVPERFVQLSSNFLNDCFFRTSLPVRCKVAFIAAIALYITILFLDLPPPDPQRELPAPGPEGIVRCATWKEGLGIEDTPEHYALLKRLVDLYRRSPAERHLAMVAEFDAEHATVLSRAKNKNNNGGGGGGGGGGGQSEHKEATPSAVGSGGGTIGGGGAMQQG